MLIRKVLVYSSGTCKQFRLSKLENILKDKTYYSKYSMNEVINHLHNRIALLYFSLVDELLI